MTKKIEHDLVAERTATIVRAIASGVNDCNTLMCGGKLNVDFVSGAVRPTIKVCIDELDQLRRDNAAIRATVNETAFFLEYIRANVPDADKYLAQAHEEYTRRTLTGDAPHNRN